MSEVVAIGECMLELGLAGPAQAALGYAGDTFNTAVYLSRLGRSVAYATAVGADDPFSRGILDAMAMEGLDASLVARAPGRLPGAYAIERDAAGERRFYYWRSESPARDYMSLADLAALTAAMAQARLVYVSGITLAVFGEGGRAALLDLLAQARGAGAQVALDTNYRPQLWAGPAQARAALDAAAPLCAYVSASAPDLQSIFGDQARADTWAAAGAEVLLRAEDHAITVHTAGDVVRIPAEATVRALDTTGAGDAFNAGYLNARLAGRDAPAAVREARTLAGIVVQHVGAIIPRAAMPPRPGGQAR